MISYAMKFFIKVHFSHIEVLELAKHEIYQNAKDVLGEIMLSDVILLV